MINKYLQKLLPILTPLSLIIGVLLPSIGKHGLFLVPWLFAFMTFSSSLSMRVQDVKVFKTYPRTILLSIAFLHLLMPLWAYFISTLFFDDTMLTIGFIIAVAVPTGVTSVIWVNICRGHLPLCLAIILIDTLLAPIIMPTLLHIIVGEAIEINTQGMLIDLLWMIVVPTLLGIALNELTKGKLKSKVGHILAPLSKLCIFGVVMINGSAISPYLQKLDWHLASIILAVLFMSITGYAFAMLIGILLFKRDAALVTTFMYIGGMRNIAFGVVVATSYFPPKIAMPVVFGMLFQQVLASFFSKVIEVYRRKYAANPTIITN